jgi:predicted double-glycine peptidase
VYSEIEFDCETISIKRYLMNIIDLNEMRQTYDYDCGPKALQTVIAYYGIDVREEKLLKQLDANDDGTKVSKIIEVAKRYGFKVKHGTISLSDLKETVNSGYPVIVLVQAWSGRKMSKEDWEKDWEDGHYVVVIGAEREMLVFEDPSSIRRTWLTDEEFMTRWHDVDTDTNEKLLNYAIILYGIKSDKKDYEHMD